MKTKLPNISIRLHGLLTARECVDLAVAADESGFATCWFAENAFARGILPAAAACAVATRRIAIGAGVFNPFSRHPSMMAMELGALDELSDGRTSLSIGAGIGSAVQKLGLDSSKPVVALRDTLAIVKPMLRGERVSYTGKAFSALNVGLDYRPRRNVPIFLAGRGALTLQLCGESADGLLISNMCSREFAANAAGVVNAARAASGRSGRAMIVQYMPCAVRETHFEAREAGRRAVGELVPGFWALSKKVTSAKEGLVAGTGIDATEFERAAVAISGGADPAETLSDKFTDAFSLTGTPDECLAQAAKYAAAGITELALTFDGPGAIDQIKLLGSAFQRAG